MPQFFSMLKYNMHFSKSSFDKLVRKYFPIYEQFVDSDEEDVIMVNETSLDTFRGTNFDYEVWETIIDPYIKLCIKQGKEVGSLPNNDIKKLIDKYKFSCKSKVDWKFITICPRSRMDLNMVDTMCAFCDDFFDNNFSKYFEEIHYVVESGKNKDSPNLHIHFVAKPFKDGMHNFRRDLVKKWNFYFCEDYDISYKIYSGLDDKGKKKYNEGINTFPVRTAEILEDKIKYLSNDSKGTHENFMDLGIYKHLKFEG